MIRGKFVSNRVNPLKGSLGTRCRSEHEVGGRHRANKSNAYWWWRHVLSIHYLPFHCCFCVVIGLSLPSVSDSSTISLMADTRDEGQLRVKGGRVADDGFDNRFWHAIYSLVQCTKRSKIKAGRKNKKKKKKWKLLKDRGYTMKNSSTRNQSIYKYRKYKKE